MGEYVEMLLDRIYCHHLSFFDLGFHATMTIPEVHRHLMHVAVFEVLHCPIETLETTALLDWPGGRLHVYGGASAGKFGHCHVDTSA